MLQPTQASKVYKCKKVIKHLQIIQMRQYSPVYFVPIAAEIIAHPLSVLVNQSFELGHFPSCLKAV